MTRKNVRLTLPPGSLAEARDQAKLHRGLLVLRRDPALEAHRELEARREAHAKAIPVADALERYRASVMAATSKPGSRRKRLRVLDRALQGFMARPVASLTRGELLERLDAIQINSGNPSRNRAQSELRHFLGWTHARDIVQANVLDRVRQRAPEVSRDRVLADGELAALMLATSDGSLYSDLVRVLLHTGARRNEIATLRVDDLDFTARTITIRAEVSKTKVGRTIPLDEAIAGRLAGRARGLRQDAFVFGEGIGEKPAAGFARRFARLMTRMPAGMPHFTLHDIRRTVATRMHEAGVDTLVIEDLLGHLSGVRRGVAGTYNRSRTLERQRQALEAWSATLQAIAAE